MNWHDLFQKVWNYDDQIKLENAITKLFLNENSKLCIDDPDAWQQVSNHIGGEKSAVDCLSRYLIMREIGSDWYAHVYPFDKYSVNEIQSGLRPPSPLLNSKVSVEKSPEKQGNEDDDLELLERGRGGAFKKFPSKIRTIPAPVMIHDDEKEQSVQVLSQSGVQAREDNGDEEDDESIDSFATDSLPAVTFAGVELYPTHAGTQLKIDSMGMIGVSIASCTILGISTQCNRCGNLITAVMRGATLNIKSRDDDDENEEDATNTEKKPENPELFPTRSASEHTEWCSKCSLQLSTKFRPSLLHNGSSTLGYIDSLHCTTKSVLQVSLYVVCIDCDSILDVQSWTPPQPVEMACKKCYKRIRIVAKSFTPVEVSQSVAFMNEVRQKKNIKRTMKLPTAMYVLPRFGLHLGFKNHWEGGRGQRRKRFLDSRDRKKYSESILKTKSKKNTRVGKAAVSLREGKKHQLGKKIGSNATVRYHIRDLIKLMKVEASSKQQQQQRQENDDDDASSEYDDDGSDDEN
jgi:hypothetical protein